MKWTGFNNESIDWITKDLLRQRTVCGFFKFNWKMKCEWLFPWNFSFGNSCQNAQVMQVMQILSFLFNGKEICRIVCTPTSVNKNLHERLIPKSASWEVIACQRTPTCGLAIKQRTGFFGDFLASSRLKWFTKGKNKCCSLP